MSFDFHELLLIPPKANACEIMLGYAPTLPKNLPPSSLTAMSGAENLIKNPLRNSPNQFFEFIKAREVIAHRPSYCRGDGNRLGMRATAGTEGHRRVDRQGDWRIWIAIAKILP